MKSTVYLVSVGEYSDYRILAAFSDAELAGKAAGLLAAGVETFTLDPDGFVDPGMDFWDLWMNRDGSIHAVQERSRLSPGDQLDQTARPRAGRISLHAFQKDYKGDPCDHWTLCWSGYAKSKEHAIREANEIRRQILAGQRPPGVDMGKN